MLKYIGQGFIPGIPARDLKDHEVEKFGEEFLLKTGLFAKPEEKILVEEIEEVEEGEEWQDQEH